MGLAVVALIAAFIQWEVALAVFVIGIGAFILVSSTLSGIFRACLYRYALTGSLDLDYRHEHLHGAFHKDPEVIKKEQKKAAKEAAKEARHPSLATPRS